MKTLKIYNTLLTELFGTYRDYYPPALDYKDRILTALQHQKIDLSEYADCIVNKKAYKKIHRIQMTAEEYKGVLYGTAICTVDEDWTDDDTDFLKSFLCLEYSEAWGLRFTEKPICTVTRYEVFEMEAPDGERFDRLCCMKYDLVVEFWHTTMELITEEELHQR